MTDRTNEDKIYSPYLQRELTFFPVKKNETSSVTCKKCILQKILKECYHAPCAPFDRDDGQNGYFSIHEMPNEKQQ